ncbi:uncharacterized protein PG986_002770 [Apiospora aurea]|uniref:Uncharacterized protein n=1 Tax=Apiospora aurea TaxID=335848 RepID=A0ABR1QPZ2_9PEZI
MTLVLASTSRQNCTSSTASPPPPPNRTNAVVPAVGLTHDTWPSCFLTNCDTNSKLRTVSARLRDSSPGLTDGCIARRRQLLDEVAAGRRDPAYPDARQCPSLGQGRGDDGFLVANGRDGWWCRRGCGVVEERPVDLVGEQDDVVMACHVNYACQDVAWDRRARGVVGVVDHDHLIASFSSVLSFMHLSSVELLVSWEYADDMIARPDQGVEN